MNRAFYLNPALLLLLALFTAGIASAQSSDVSPYSRYGIGDLQDQSSVLNFSMGGTGIAYHNDSITPFFVNLKNPASYAYGFIPYEDTSGKGGIKMATFETGVINNSLSLTTEGQTTRSSNAFLSYIAFNIPVSRHFGLGMGLTPVSTEGYNITTNYNVPSITKNGTYLSDTIAENQYQGYGGINKVYLAAGWSPFKGFALGVNGSYMFGNLTNEEDVYLPPNINGFNTLKIEDVDIHSFYADFGMMYTFRVPFAHKWTITLGATYAPPLNINASYSGFAGSQYVNGGSLTTMDTVIDTSYNGKLKMLTIKEGEQWTISFDYTQQDWNQFLFFGQSENLTESYKYAFGMQFVPKKLYARSYFQRIHYRIGASYGQDYLDLNNTPLKETNFTFGLGLPIGPANPFRNPAIINLAIQFGSMGTTSNGLIQENYVKLMAAFTFDDRWFDKHKFQ
jgi:hypothetical protein